MDSSFLSDTFCLPVDIPTGGENRGSTDTGLTTTVCRNGTESRDSLPLWGEVEWRALHRWPDEWVAGWFKLVKCRQYGNSGKNPFLHSGKDMKCKNEKAQSQSLPQ